MLNPRIHYTLTGWVIDTPFGLGPRQLEAAIAFHRKVQGERIRLMWGDKRKACEAAMATLSLATIRQNVQPNEYHEHIIAGGP